MHVGADEPDQRSPRARESVLADLIEARREAITNRWLEQVTAIVPDEPTAGLADAVETYLFDLVRSLRTDQTPTDDASRAPPISSRLRLDHLDTPALARAHGLVCESVLAVVEATEILLPLPDVRGLTSFIAGGIADAVGRAKEERIAEQLRHLEQRGGLLRAVLEQLPTAVAIFDAETGRTLLANAQNARIFGREVPATVDEVRRSYAALSSSGAPLPPEAWPIRRSIKGGEVVPAQDIEIVRADGTHGFIRANSAPIVDADGHTVAEAVVYDDITRAKEDAERLRFLADATKHLASSLDVASILDTLVAIVVPRLADGCLIELSAVDGGAEQHAAAHVDPAKVELARALRRRYPLSGHVPRGPGQVVRTGRADLIPRVTDDILASVARDEGHLRLLRGLDIRSILVAPLVARGGVIGALTFVASDSGRVFGEEDLAFAKEVASRAALAVENARLYELSQQAVRLRDEFLSVASHELKTPLTTLDLLVSSISRGARGAAAQLPPERVKKLDQQVARLKRLVDQLLDVSRLSEGRLRLEPRTTDLVPLATEIAARFHDEATRRGSPITLRAPAALSGQWDPDRLDQVITNLVSNAVKYGAGAPITLELARVSRPAGDVARVSVSDRGVGIAPVDQQRLFQRFERAASSRNFGGMGLGLWIVKQLVEAHGGTVTVASQPQQGATFVVELPLEPA